MKIPISPFSQAAHKRRSAPARSWALTAGLMISGTIFVSEVYATALTPAQASGLDLGAFSAYALVHIGSATLGWNSGPVNGDILFGQGLTANLSGGNSGGLGTGYKGYTDNTSHISGALQNPFTFLSASTSLTELAATVASDVSNYASGLTATQTFSSISNGATITGNGGLNVINVTKIQDAAFTIVGTADDYFIFNVSDKIHTNRTMTLSGGVLPSHVLYNLTGTGTVLQTAGGNSLVGTFLASNGGAFTFSSLNLNGELINIGGNIQLVSGSQIQTASGFEVPVSATPEPGTLSMLFGAGTLLSAVFVRRSKLTC